MADKPTCFMIMPITVPDIYLPMYGNDSDHFIHVMEYLFIPAIKEAGFEPYKPIATGADVIQGEIIQNVEKTDLVLCDMSTLNANVFFELGMRTSLNKRICLVKDSSTKKLPFDTSIINYHTYESIDVWKIDSEKEKLIEHIKKSYDKKDNSLWKYFSLSAKGTEVKTSSDETSQIEYLSQQIQALREEIKYKSENIDVDIDAGSLTLREIHIIKLISEGLTSSEIAERLSVSKRTIDSHRTHLIHKLNLKSLPDLIKFAINFNDSNK